MGSPALLLFLLASSALSLDEGFGYEQTEESRPTISYGPKALKAKLQTVKPEKTKRNFLDTVVKSYSTRKASSDVNPCKRGNTRLVTVSRGKEVDLSLPVRKNGLYRNNMMCRWVLRAPKALKVKIQFEKVSLEGGSCQNDYLVLMDGKPKTEKIIANVCGFDTPDPVYSTGSALHLLFRSDNTLTFSGFRIKVSAVTEKDREAPPFKCPGGSVTLGDTGGIFASPGYSPPSVYKNNEVCQYHISVPEGQLIQISIKDIAIETSNRCKYDSLVVYDGSDASFPELARLCGQPRKVVFVSSTNQVFAIFTSDHLIGYRGFRAEYEAIPSDGPAGPCGEPVFPPNLNRVVGGTIANPHSWPWAVSILFSYYSWAHWCGGTILNERYILTAAHCVYSDEFTIKPEAFLVVLGNHGLYKVDRFERTFEVEEIFRHPKYNHDTSDFDAAILKLKQTITFSPAIKPACLPENVTSADTLCLVAGWGETYSKWAGDYALANTVFGPSSKSPVCPRDERACNDTVSDKSFLNQAFVPIVDQSVCKDSRHYGDQIKFSMLCAGYEAGGIDSCSGDSGGPLVCEDPDNINKFILHGIVSWGYECGEPRKPGVYTNVYKIRRWIKRIANIQDEQPTTTPPTEEPVTTESVTEAANTRIPEVTTNIQTWTPESVTSPQLLTTSSAPKTTANETLDATTSA